MEILRPNSIAPASMESKAWYDSLEAASRRVFEHSLVFDLTYTHLALFATCLCRHTGLNESTYSCIRPLSVEREIKLTLVPLLGPPRAFGLTNAPRSRGRDGIGILLSRTYSFHGSVGLLDLQPSHCLLSVFFCSISSQEILPSNESHPFASSLSIKLDA